MNNDKTLLKPIFKNCFIFFLANPSFWPTCSCWILMNSRGGIKHLHMSCSQVSQDPGRHPFQESLLKLPVSAKLPDKLERVPSCNTQGRIQSWMYSKILLQIQTYLFIYIYIYISRGTWWWVSEISQLSGWIQVGGESFWCSSRL